MAELKIVSLNCFGIPTSWNRNIRFNYIADRILELKPDLVTLQEVFIKSDREILIKKLSGVYDYYPKKFQGMGPGGLLVFGKNNLNIEDFEFHKFHDPGPLRLVSIPDISSGKGFQTFKINFSNKKIQIIHAHTLCGYGRDPQMLDSITNQLNQINDFIKDQNVPMILAGDLNCYHYDQFFIDFTNKLKLKEKLATSEFTIDLNNLNRGKIYNLYLKGNVRTDYVMANSKLTIDEEKIIFNEYFEKNNKRYQPSDHFGILAEIIC